MPTHPLHTQSIHALLALLDALERPSSVTQRTRVRRLRAQLQRDLPRIEEALPLEADTAYIVERGSAYSAPRLAILGGKHSRQAQRRAIIRTLQLLHDDRATLAPVASPAMHVASILGASVGRFSDRHPVLVTIILLAILFVTIWRESFQLTTKFAGTEITITGQHAPAERSYPALPEVFGPTAP